MDPFNFCTALDQTILLGTKARTIGELLDGIRTVPKSSIYFHTHRFLRAHHYLTPEPSNDFGGWVAQTLNNVVLGEKLSSIDVVQFHNIDDLMDQIANMIAQEIGNGSAAETCPPGEEFHFMASRLFVMRTPFTARSLREFRELLARLSLDSLYYHIFDSKLRLENGQNDFSRWFQSLGKTELADEVARLDPYTYTLEGLRKRLIILTAKHDLT